MKVNTSRATRNARLAGAMALLCFVAAVVLAPIGSFAVWVLGGATVFFAFLAVFHLVPPPAPKKPFRHKKRSAAEEATRAHIAYHMPLLISLLLAGLLFVIVALFFFG